MAKLEIPSIVVQSGTHTPSTMDRTTARTQWSLSTQSTYEEECEPMDPSREEPDRAQPVQNMEESKCEIVPNNNNNPPRSRSKGNLKLLKRSHAINESTSPPPDISFSPVNSPTIPTSVELPVTPITINNNNNNVHNNNNGGALNARPTVKREGSTQSIDSNWSSTLSRGNSFEQQYNDPSMIDIEQFLIDTLNKNSKDRMFLLKIENELVTLAKDSRKNAYKFGAMSSYQRLLVHRVAQYFGMEHNVDASGQSVIVNKSKVTRLPENRFSNYIRDDLILPEEPPRRSILKRDSASFEDTSPDRQTVDAPRRSKSFEEREEEYEKARRRIFHQDQMAHNPEYSEEDLLRWQTAGSTWTGLDPNPDSTKLHPNRSSRLTKVESYEGKDTLKANSLRSSVSKSFSFGGYDQTPNSRVLTKQDSGSSSVSSRVSPSSSGYKSQSQRSDTTMSATPSPTATPLLTTQLSSQSGVMSPEPEHEVQPTVMWAVTNMAAVPAGSVLINPHTGQPYKNDDGTVYHYDPKNPPKFEATQNLRPVVAHQPGPQIDTQTVRPDTPPVGQAQMSIPADATVTPLYPTEPPHHTENELPQTPSLPQHTPTYHHLQPFQTQPQALTAPSAGPSHFANSSMLYTNPNPNPYNMIVAHPSNAESGYPTSPLVRNLPGSSNGQFAPVTTSMPVMGPAAPPMPVYLAPPASAPVPAGPVPPARYPCAAYPQLPMTDHPGGDCSYPQTTPVHPLFSRCSPSTQMAGASNYCTTNGAAGGMLGLVQLPPGPLPPNQPTRSYHRMPTPPNTPQNGYPIYTNGYPTLQPCYSHYQPTNQQQSQMPMPQLLRPSLQLGVSNSPPLRQQRPRMYNGAGRPAGIREVEHSTQLVPTTMFFNPTVNTPQGPVPYYHFAYRSTDFPARPVNHNPRALPPPKPRVRQVIMDIVRSVQTGQFNERTIFFYAPRGQLVLVRKLTPGSWRPANQQQAALANAIEAAGHPPTANNPNTSSGNNPNNDLGKP